MSDHVNLSPGSIVPATGNYKCEFCGEGGFADFMSRDLLGTGLNAAALQQFSNQSSQRYFVKGKVFPECPTCGPATGWSLIQNASVPQASLPGKHGEVVVETVVCDICNRRVERPFGYLLITGQVVRSPEFWKHYYSDHRTELAKVGIRDYEEFRRHAVIREQVVKMFAGQSNAWMVCDSCINKFDVDIVQARQHAERWWESEKKFVPPGSGPVGLSSVRMKPKADHSQLIASLIRGVIGFVMWAAGSSLIFIAERASMIANRNPDAEGEAIALIVGIQLGLAILGSPVCWLIWKYVFRERHGFGVLTFWFLCLIVGILFYFART